MAVKTLGRSIRYVDRFAQGVWHRGRDSLSNALLRWRLQRLNPRIPRPFPRKIQIEATGRCNLRCPSCSHAFDRGGRHLMPEELRTILDRLPRRPASVILSGTGEPLVNDRFLELVDLLAERHIECGFYTNGTLLTPDVADALLARPNITYLAISCDGARRETFESLRRGASFDRWREQAADFLTKVNRRQPHPMLVCTHTVLTRKNLEEMEDIIRLSAELGFHRLHFIDAIPVDTGASDLTLTDAQCAALDPARFRRLGHDLNLPVFFNLRRLPRARRPVCLQPWEYIQIKPGGDVLPCFAIFGSDKLQAMGNLFQQDFQDIWYGSAFADFRRTYIQGTNPLCGVCPYA